MDYDSNYDGLWIMIMMDYDGWFAHALVNYQFAIEAMAHLVRCFTHMKNGDVP